MSKEIKFSEKNMGGYTLFLWLSGVCAGMTFSYIWFLVLVFACFFIAVNYYIKDKGDQERKDFIDVEVKEE